jgi:hypothetical protein
MSGFYALTAQVRIWRDLDMLICGSGKCGHAATLWLKVRPNRELWTVRCDQCAAKVEWFSSKVIRVFMEAL